MITDWLAEHAALRETAGVIDLSFRSRICLVGADRARYLHGQVTNDVKKLRVGDGCYSAVTTAKGKMESDLNIFALADELLLDFEPGLAEKISARLERFIVADDVQIVDAAPHYGLLSVQGPKAAEVINALGLFGVGWGERPRELLTPTTPDGSSVASPHQFPTKPFASMKISDATLGEIYLVNHARLSLVAAGILPAVEPAFQPGGTVVANPTHKESLHATPDGKMPPSKAGGTPAAPIFGFDLFVPNNSLGAVADKLIAAAKQLGGRAVGWQAFASARIEAGIPRFGADMDETKIPLECAIESRAIVYNKGCYIGQEVINRIHSVGHVNKELRALRLATNLEGPLPVKGDKLFHAGKEVGYVTSAVKSPTLNTNIALGYVRREANQIGNETDVADGGGRKSGENCGVAVCEMISLKDRSRQD
ncbi:MAG: glycine cleavage T C-terminal barrel domain-containing protein [Limisphaerales bacterium]